MPQSAYPNAENPVSFTIELEDIRRANWLFWRRKMLGGLKRAPVIVILLLALLAIFFLLREPPGLLSAFMLVTVAFVPAVYLFSAASIFVFNRFSAPAEFERQKELHRAISYWWDEDALHVAIAETDLSIRWDSFLFAAENDDLFLFREGTLLMRIIAKRALTADQVADLRDIIECHGLSTVRTKLPPSTVHPAPAAPRREVPENAIRFHYTDRDLANGMRLYYLRWLLSRKGVFSLVRCGLVFAALLLLLNFVGWPFLPYFPPPFIAATAAAFVFLLIVIAYIQHWPLGRFQARRAMRLQRTLGFEQFLWWDGEGLHYWNEQGKQSVFWSEVVKTAEDRNLFLIYNAPRLYQLVPKRVISAQQRQELAALIKKNGL